MIDHNVNSRRPCYSQVYVQPQLLIESHIRFEFTASQVSRAVAAPSPALLVSKSTAVDPVTTWVLHPRRDRHIGASITGSRCDARCRAGASSVVRAQSQSGSCGMAGVERFSKTARNYDSNKSPTLDPTVNACKRLAWVRPQTDSAAFCTACRDCRRVHGRVVARPMS